MAQGYRLDGFKDLALIGAYAERFSLKPNDVLDLSHNDVLNFTIMWKEQREFEERYRKIVQEASNVPKK